MSPNATPLRAPVYKIKLLSEQDPPTVFVVWLSGATTFEFLKDELEVEHLFTERKSEIPKIPSMVIEVPQGEPQDSDENLLAYLQLQSQEDVRQQEEVRKAA